MQQQTQYHLCTEAIIDMLVDKGRYDLASRCISEFQLDRDLGLVNQFVTVLMQAKQYRLAVKHAKDGDGNGLELDWNPYTLGMCLL